MTSFLLLPTLRYIYIELHDIYTCGGLQITITTLPHTIGPHDVVKAKGGMIRNIYLAIINITNFQQYLWGIIFKEKEFVERWL